MRGNLPDPPYVLPFLNRADGQIWNAIVRLRKAEIIKARGAGAAKELAFNVPSTLMKPLEVFRGLRDSGNDRGLCYVGKPEFAYDPNTGSEIKPSPNEVFLVFLSHEFVVYNWRWEESDPGNADLPESFSTRFHEKVEYRDVSDTSGISSGRGRGNPGFPNVGPLRP